MNYYINRGDRSVSVTELNNLVKGLLDSEPLFADIYVRGEISNFKAHSSGHYYFSLKDEGGAVKAVMFRSYAAGLPFFPENGMKVIAHGRVSAFVRDGQYQLYVDSMEADGVGSLYVAFEQLKAKLSAEGLFDTGRKKPLPGFPRRVGVITSPTGAAVRDIINILGRRFPMAEVVIYPALVQGPEAPLTLCKGISLFNEAESVDVIIIGRGGGSIEDLWAFNDEMLARTVAASRIPVISAVGHETDFTICDFVADVRAPTPSAAAELAVPDAYEVRKRMEAIASKNAAVLLGRLDAYKNKIRSYSKMRALTSPEYMLEDKRMYLLSISKSLEASSAYKLRGGREKLAAYAGKLQALNPMAVISRGYSAVFDADGAVIKSVEQLSVGDEVCLKMADGEATAEIKNVIS